MRFTRDFPPLWPVLAICLLTVGCSDRPDAATPAPAIGPEPAEFVGSDGCAGCHAEQFNKWLGSHHQLAMQAATAESVLGNFADARFDYFGIRSRFFTRDGQFWVETDNSEGRLQEFAVRYTFGVEPLQQYLVEFPGGRLQVLPIAWDSRPEENGGQRWFHLYQDEFIGSDDQLHWTGREQNWNYMCAECHSTNLEKNYEIRTDTFATSWSEINVGCEACHGPSSRHVALAESAISSGGSNSNGGFLVDLDDSGAAQWIMNPETGIADRSELPMNPQKQPEACGRCHSRRALSASEYQYGKPLLDTHRAALLDDPLYYPDGQIHGEVYVYGSFLQSKMYRAGVTCSDCHDPHSATLKTAGAVSGVCSTCHLPDKFANTDHHKHAALQVQCVDCHMPSRDYMVVDGRRDHSFRIPRPDLTVATGSPNACAACHDDRSAEWADRALREWFGESRPDHYATAIFAGRSGSVDANRQLTAAAENREYPGIARATALTLIRPPHSRDTANAVRLSLKSSDALIRMGALQALQGFAPEVQAEWSTALLRDPVRSIRIAAVDVLSPLRELLPAPEMENFRAAEREFIDAQLAIAERPEALGNLGNLFAEEGNAERALQFYRLALQKEPRSTGIRVNLADLYRRLKQDAQAESLLREGLSYDGDHAALRHALGLSLVRSQRHEEALQELRQATELDPDNPRYAYVYAIALNSLGEPETAILTLRSAHERFPGDFEIVWTLVTVLRDQGRLDEARAEAGKMLERFPDDEGAQALLRSLQ